MKAKRSRSGRSSRSSTEKRADKSVGRTLIQSLKIAVRHARGEVELHDITAPALSDAQRHELRDRLAHHRAHPDEPGVTLDDIRRKLLSR